MYLFLGIQIFKQFFKQPMRWQSQ